MGEKRLGIFKVSLLDRLCLEDSPMIFTAFNTVEQIVP